MTIKSLLRYLFSWRGRLGRRQFIAALYIVGAAQTLLLFAAIFSSAPKSPNEGHLHTPLIEFTLFGLTLIGVIPQFSMIVRRAHDLNISALRLIAIIAGLTLYTALINQMAIAENSWQAALTSIPVLVPCFCFVLVPGSDRENRFGPPQQGWLPEYLRQRASKSALADS